MISFSVGSGNPDKQSYENPHEHSQDEWICCFQDRFILGEATSSYFFRVNTSTQQFSYFVGTAISKENLFFFWRAPFSEQSLIVYAALVFSEQPFFRTKLLPSSQVLKVGSLKQLLFGTDTFLVDRLFRIKVHTKELLFWSRYFCTASTFSEELHFRKKLIFQKSNIPHYLLFLDSWRFRVASFSKEVTFYSGYLFRRVTFSQHTFSKVLLFHS